MQLVILEEPLGDKDAAGQFADAPSPSQNMLCEHNSQPVVHVMPWVPRLALSALVRILSNTMNSSILNGWVNDSQFSFGFPTLYLMGSPMPSLGAPK